MKIVYLIAFAQIIFVNSIAYSQDVLVKTDDKKTYVDCSLANAALAAGFFDQFKNPRIVGDCEKPKAATVVSQPFPQPMFPVSPIAPWCDCTDDMRVSLQALFKEHSFAINPGFSSNDPVEDWANSLNTTKEKIVKPSFWKDGAAPDMRRLKYNRYLQFQN